MPELRCTVQTCAHNKEFYCDLDKIQVGGDKACIMTNVSAMPARSA